MNLFTSGLSAVLATLTTSALIEKDMNSPNIETIKPIDIVSIIIPSFNEEMFVQKCVSSIREQSIIQEYPKFFETILVDSGSNDNTVKIAEPYIDKIINVPIRGKITAKNIAIDQAKGNIIVSVDSDSYYNRYWLNNLLEPFNNINNPKYENLAGVVGSTYDPWIPGIPTPIRNITELFRHIIYPTQMVGRNCAFWKHDFYLSGKYDETINQMNAYDMIQEEEFLFGEKLSKLGKIIFKMNANCIHQGSERIGCRLGTINPDRCIKYGIGIERFGNTKIQKN